MKHWPCKHIVWYDEQKRWALFNPVYVNCMDLRYSHISRDWNHCPICGAKRPKKRREVIKNFNWKDRIKSWWHCLIHLHQEVRIYGEHEVLDIFGMHITLSPPKEKYLGCYQCDEEELAKIQTKVFKS